MRWLFVLVLFSTGFTFACDTDVTILEGNAIAFCHGSNTAITASAGFESYTWSGPQSGTGTSIFPSISGTFTVEATDDVGCVSTASITVTVHPAPFGIINSSEGNVLCPGASTVLSLTDSYVDYTWNTGSTQPILFVSAPGVYSVIVTDVNGCSSNTSILISSPNFQINVSDTILCTGQSVSLQATGGSSYLWSTGATTQDITANASGIYFVTITNASGCSSVSNEIIVSSQQSFNATATAVGPTAVCSGAFVTLVASSGSSYLWSNGATTQKIVAKSSGK